nr:uncharacterized mitochondrial protein AtMg00810-like [Tanacetum cinerariifolium]
MRNNSRVKFKETDVEDHHRNSSFSNKTKSVTVCNNILNSRTSNVYGVYADCRQFDSGCIKHMTGNLKLLCNFVEKIMGTVHFRDDQFAPTLGYQDLIQGIITIKRVYFIEGLNHNISQSDLCTISIHETTSSTSIGFMAKASPIQAWLWHRRLLHLNFDYINMISRKDIMLGLPKLKYVKDHLCLSCEMSKAKRISFKSKDVPSSKGRLNLLHMDLYGPMRVASINGKKYIMAKYALKILKKHGMEKCYTIGTPLATKPKLDSDLSGKPVFQTDYRSKISSLMYLQSSRPDLVKAVCYCARYQAKPTKKHLKEVKRIFKYLKGTINMGLWYPKDFGFELTAFSDADHAGCIDTGKSTYGGIQFLGDKLVGISHETFVARSPQQNGVVERRNHTLLEAARTISLEPALHEMTPATISSRLMTNPPPSTQYVLPLRIDWDILFQPLFDKLLNPPPSVDLPAPEVIALIAKVVAPVLAASTEENHDLAIAHMNNDSFFGVEESLKTLTFRDDPLYESLHEDSTSQGSSSNMRQTHTPFKSLGRWTKDHLIANMISDPSRSVSTRKQLQTDAMWCSIDAFLTSVEPKTSNKQ